MRKSLTVIISTLLISACSGNVRNLPVGVFDSGTGGLTVLEKLLVADNYNNETGEWESDGKPDFESESFRYLADQANMPYGQYDARGKADYLRYLVRKDAEFLMKEKRGVKIIVIACNTATAYGLEDVRKMLNDSGSGVKVIGVINAGVKAVMDKLSTEDGPCAIGVLATPGTISSGAYERTIRAEENARSCSGLYSVTNQKGYGFAESVDGEPDYVNPKLNAPRDSYQGPRLGNGEADIRTELMPAYNFEKDGLLGSVENGDLQLNSAANYARFNLVSLIETHRKKADGKPIKAVILGCTHYPFLIDTLEETVKELREMKNGDEYPYRDIIAEDFVFIDPAVYTAAQCWESLRDDCKLKKKNGKNSVEAFISVPSSELPASCLSPEGGLSYDFKYGREIGKGDDGYIHQEFSDENVDEATRERIRRMLPATYSLIW